jgi:hypothetical protein
MGNLTAVIARSRAWRTKPACALAVVACLLGSAGGASAATRSPLRGAAKQDSPTLYTVQVYSDPVPYGETPILQYQAYEGDTPVGASQGYTITGNENCPDVYDSQDYGPYESVEGNDYSGLDVGSYWIDPSECTSGFPLTLNLDGGTLPFTLTPGNFTVEKVPTTLLLSAVEGTISGGYPTFVKFTATLLNDDNDGGTPVHGVNISFGYANDDDVVNANACTAETETTQDADEIAECELTYGSSATDTAEIKALYNGTGLITASFAGNNDLGGASSTGHVAGLTNASQAAKNMQGLGGVVTVVPDYVVPNGCVNPDVDSDGDIISVSIGELNCQELMGLQIVTGAVFAITPGIGAIAAALGAGAAGGLAAADLAYFLGDSVETETEVTVDTEALAGADLGDPEDDPIDEDPGFGDNAAKPAATGKAVGAVAQSGAAADTDAATSTILTPTALAVNAAGDVYIGDDANHVVDEVTPNGGLSVVAGVAGNGGAASVGPAIDSPLSSPNGLALDSAGDLYIGDGGTNNVLEEVGASSGDLSILAGELGDRGVATPGKATSTNLDDVGGMAIDQATGDIYVADTLNGTVDEIDQNGQLTIVAGIPDTSGAPVVGPAVDSPLNHPTDVAVDQSTGALYIADSGNQVVEEVDSGGQLSIAAGVPDSSGLPSPGDLATDSDLFDPSGVAVDQTTGDLYIADQGNQDVEDVDSSSGDVSIVAGTPGTAGVPTPGPATSATLYNPSAVAVDGSGTVYIADSGNSVVEKVSGGTLSVFAGTGATDPFTNIQATAVVTAGRQMNVIAGVEEGVGSAQWMSSGDQTTAEGLLSSDETGLLSLSNQLGSDTTVAQADADYKSIYSDYQFYGLVLPQIDLAVASDDLTNGGLPSMQDAYSKLSALLGPDGDYAGDGAQLQTTLDDLEAQISAIGNDTPAAPTLLSYTAAQYGANDGLLGSSESAMGNADNAVTQGNDDISTIMQVLDVGSDPDDPTTLAAVQSDQAVITSAGNAAADDVTSAHDTNGEDPNPEDISPADGTSTAISCAPASLSTGAATTCTATVTDTDSAGASAPTGSVSFSSSPSTASFGSSGSCTLTADNGSSGSCHVNFTPSATGSYKVSAAYGATDLHSASSGQSASLTATAASSPGSTTTTTATTTTTPTTALTGTAASATPKVGSITVSGRSVRVELGCSGAGSCDFGLKLSAIETLKGGKPVATAASARRKAVRKTVALGSGSAVIKAGSSRTVALSLNGVGRKLLKDLERLRAKLTITDAGRTLAERAVTFKAAR